MKLRFSLTAVFLFGTLALSQDNVVSVGSRKQMLSTEFRNYGNVFSDDLLIGATQ